MSLHQVTMKINGSMEQVTVPANMTLLTMLRQVVGLTGTKNGCTAGECGACTVLIDGEPTNSCMIFAGESDGKDIVTVEALAEEGRLSILQESIVEEGGVQCGFCTPGMLISAKALLDRTPNPTDEQIRAALVGNLCRCTGYVRIINAVHRASAHIAEG